MEGYGSASFHGDHPGQARRPVTRRGRGGSLALEMAHPFFLSSTAFALVISEIIVRFYDLDWRILKKTLYYQQVDQPLHMAVPDPDLLFRLKPNTGVTNPCGIRPSSVSINSHGARGQEHSAEKPSGVFRIICLGGSNVYGACVDDHETWPARLEQELNKADPGRFEVWNLGTPAYVPVRWRPWGARPWSVSRRTW